MRAPALLATVAGVVALTTEQWKRRTIYQVVTDRFALGKDDQDTCEDVGQCQWGNFCGGTFQGVTSKLDYISGMGFDAIWISPVVEQVPCGYHGYWAKNLSSIEARFGGEDGLKELLQAAHARGMAVMLDVVFNHMGPTFFYRHNLTYDMFDPFDKEEYFHGSPGYLSHEYANDDDIDQHQREVGWVGSGQGQTPDLAQENPYVTKKLLEWIRDMLVKYKFDGIRIDSSPYVNKTFYKQLTAGDTLGECFAMGEVLVGGKHSQEVPYIASYQYTPADAVGDAGADGVEGRILDGVLNYPLWGNIRNTFATAPGGGYKAQLSDFLWQWGAMNATFDDIGACGNFVDNHDQPRWFVDSPDPRTYKTGFVASMFLPGIPIGYYGSEQGLRGSGEAPGQRSPLWSHGYDTEADLYKFTRRAVLGRKKMLDGIEKDRHLDQVLNMTAVDGAFLSFQRGSALVVLSQLPRPGTQETLVTVPTHFAPGTLVCDALAAEAYNVCVTVTGDGTVQTGVDGIPKVFLPPEGRLVGPGFALALSPLWLLPVVVALYAALTRRRVITVVDVVPCEKIDGPIPSPTGPRPKTVLVASLEHVITTTDGKAVKVVAGGLGKVAGLLCQFHPGEFISVHPCMQDKDYSFATKVAPLSVTVAGKVMTCDILEYAKPAEGTNPKVTFYLVDHPVFRVRPDGIYPTPQTKKDALVFYSLWNQATAGLIDRLRPDLYHCPDFHTAMAPLYLVRPVPVIVVLHNAEYQGSIETQQMGPAEVQWLSSIFNLTEQKLREDVLVDGGFNMLKPVIAFVKRHQKGYGVCGVSKNYALEVQQKLSVLWGLPEVRGIDNCMPESDRMATAETEELYWERKRAAKKTMQARFNLNPDPAARLFVFLGRWVKQKGMDYIADVTDWMLSTYPDAQLIMVGPVNDSYGSYACRRLQAITETGKFTGRLFVYADFLMVPPELKLACDFCLMPSRDEPFGYVDIEFAWFGASTVGSFRGGLGKVPGFYFPLLNADSAAHVQASLCEAVSAAMECDISILEQMSVNARKTMFPVEDWQQEMLALYSVAMANFSEAGGVTGTLAGKGLSEPLLGNGKNGVAASDPEVGDEEEKEMLKQETSEETIQKLVEAKLAVATLTRKTPQSAPDLLAEVQWELELSKEDDPLTLFLGISYGGVLVIDVIIALAYISGPIMCMVFSASLAQADPPLGLDILNAKFEVVKAGAEAVAILLWTGAALVVPPNRLIAVSLLCRPGLMVCGLLGSTSFATAICQGVVGPSDCLLIYFNFMGCAQGNVAKLAVRTGVLMAMRSATVWLAGPIVNGIERVDLWVSVMLILALGASRAAWKAPSSYRNFRLPNFGPQIFGAMKVSVLRYLCLASIARGFAIVPATAFLVWRTTNFNWSPYAITMTQLDKRIAVSAFAAPVVVGMIVRGLPNTGVMVVKSFAFFSIPYVTLLCSALVHINHATEFPGALGSLAICFGVDSVYTMSWAVVVLATVGSRWRFVAYTCVVTSLTAAARAASFSVLESNTQPDLPYNSDAPRSMGTTMVLTALVPAAFDMFCRGMACLSFDREATGMLKTRRQSRVVTAIDAMAQKKR